MALPLLENCWNPSSEGIFLLGPEAHSDGQYYSIPLHPSELSKSPKNPAALNVGLSRLTNVWVRPWKMFCQGRGACHPATVYPHYHHATDTNHNFYPRDVQDHGGFYSILKVAFVSIRGIASFPPTLNALSRLEQHEDKQPRNCDDDWNCQRHRDACNSGR